MPPSSADSPFSHPRTFTHGGRRIAYHEFGEGPRTFVHIHGLLMNARMFSKLGPTLAARGYRVIFIDLLGHGASEQPHEMTAYSMTYYGHHVVALLDHLGLEQAVIGGTSLGANISLEVAVAAPERVRALVIEMPVLENGLVAANALFVPLAMALRINGRGMKLLSALTRRIPRSFFMADLFIDFVRRDPKASLAILDGLTFGRIAPPPLERRKIEHPTLVVGHASDPLHPFGDADMLTQEMPNAQLLEARSIAEWRVAPRRLDRALCEFLDQVWPT